MKYELHKPQPTAITNLPLHKFVCAMARQLISTTYHDPKNRPSTSYSYNNCVELPGKRLITITLST